MKEYIDKIQAMNIIANGKNGNAYFGTNRKDWEVIDFLKSVPVADVVEREKIDKAIEEIQKLRGCSCSCSDGIIDDVEDILEKLIESEE